MKLIKVTNIKWDCEDEATLAELPTELVAGLNEEQHAELKENGPDGDGSLGDLLSDFYGWCHEGFTWEEYEGEQMLPDVDFSEV